MIDDYVFIEKYWNENWLEYIGLWTLFYLVYLLVFSIYFWIISFIGIFIYHKLIKRENINCKTTSDMKKDNETS